MKIVCFCVVYFFLTFLKVDGQNEFKLLGIVTDERYEGASVRLRGYYSPSFKELTATIENGRFLFLGKINDEYQHVQLSIHNGEVSKEIRFFLKADSMSILVGNNSGANKDDVRYFNVPFVEQEKKYFRFMGAVEDSLIAAHAEFNNAERSKAITYHKMDSLLTLLRISRIRFLEKNIQFIKQHPSDYISLYYLNRHLVNARELGADSLLAIFSLLGREMRETKLGKSLHARLSKMKSLLINEPMPEFAFKTLSGEWINLSSFKQNKYVLLCFWASWCKPCIENIPVLSELAKTYGENGLQLISISLDDNETKWVSSVKKYKLSWMQTIDDTRHTNGEGISNLYDVNLIPQYFLINRDGILIYHNFQYSETDDYSVLKNLLKRELGQARVNSN